MSLVTSTAFQISPAIQTNAFIVIGSLAASDVDDDFIYQILVAFKSALSQSSETETTTVVSMLRCICRLVPALPQESRYPCQMFWLGVAMLQSSHMAFYVEAAELVRISLETLQARGAFKYRTVSQVLYDGRVLLQDIACQLDNVLGLSFESSFSFSLAPMLFKGLRHAPLKASGEAVLRTLLRVTTTPPSLEVKNEGKGDDDDEDDDDEDDKLDARYPLHPDALGYFLALLPYSTTVKSHRSLLEDARLDAFWLPQEASDRIDKEEHIPRLSLDILGITDATTALFVSSFVGAILTSAQGYDAESEMLYILLADVATVFPEVVAMTCVPSVILSGSLNPRFPIGMRVYKIESRTHSPTLRTHLLSSPFRRFSGSHSKMQVDREYPAALPQHLGPRMRLLYMVQAKTTSMPSRSWVCKDWRAVSSSCHPTGVMQQR
jgi:hypothetical protein